MKTVTIKVNKRIHGPWDTEASQSMCAIRRQMVRALQKKSSLNRAKARELKRFLREAYEWAALGY